ncbi:chromate efflux transporter [Paenibacillus taiwanensis]|uniref:chromate efflux transporter n=1 Tax=Paenibacillus taiwanensis TaxID=401638 RepID=UPI00048C8361|nr:chromate efflux transporter [Paenibacillus taiwanensis]
MWRRWRSVGGVFVTALKLGLTSFGGPVAHIGFFHKEYVERLKWVNETQFGNLNALCQIMPGPSSSQLGIGIGMLRAGWLGGAAAWLGFTLPSACLLLSFALGLETWSSGQTGWLQGLLLVAVAVVAHAVWGMAKHFTPDRERMSIAVAALAASYFFASPYIGVVIMLIAACAGCWLYRNEDIKVKPVDHEMNAPLISRTSGIVSLGVLIGGLCLLPWLVSWSSGIALSLFDMMFRTGSLVFGGGHVVLPLIKSELAHMGWLTEETIVAGYGAAQAVPGPLFTYAAYIGASIGNGGQAILFGMIALVGIFLPSYLMMGAALPFIEHIYRIVWISRALKGANAAVVGLLIAAWYDPIFTTAVQTPLQFVVAVTALVLLVYWKLPSWSIVIAAALTGSLLFTP